jgi:hypothetical protein
MNPTELACFLVLVPFLATATPPPAATKPEKEAAQPPADDLRRPHFKPGGGDAQVFYVVFGHLGKKLDISGTKYRMKRIPEGMKVARLKATDEDCRDFSAGPHMSFLKDRPELAKAVQAAPECTTVFGEITDPPSLDYLRDTVGLITAVVDSGAVAILDVKAALWWTPADWQKYVFAPPIPDVRAHVMILISEEENGKGRWLHTRGLRKFGRPDFSAHNVSPENHDAFADAINKLAAAEADGMIFPDGQPITGKRLPQNLVLRKAGSLDDDPEFNNVHFEIRPR